MISFFRSATSEDLQRDQQIAQPFEHLILHVNHNKIEADSSKENKKFHVKFDNLEENTY